MRALQKTVSKKISISGIGLHTGQQVNLTFCPAPINYGIRFQRVDIEDEPILSAHADNVIDVSRGTSIAENKVRVNTVEHVLAALTGLEIDNVLIKIDGSEVPILDGSAIQFIELLESIPLKEQNAYRDVFEVPKSITFINESDQVNIEVQPSKQYQLSVQIDYNSTVLGVQKAQLDDLNDFKKEIASCRTFCFLHELEMLYKHNLIKGGDLSNAIVVVDRVVEEEEVQFLAELLGKPQVKINSEGILNDTQLRYQNEPARHKLLDLVGDLALVGKPITGKIVAQRPGHLSNVEIAKKIKKIMEEVKEKNLLNPDNPVLLDSIQITQMLPHRYPFLMIDKITYLDDNRVVGVKNLSINEYYFQGHFPNNPVMPGVLQVEGMAQTGGILVLNTVEDPENYWTYLLRVDECRYRKMVRPGDVIVYRCDLMGPIKRGIAKMQGYAYVNGEIVCESKMTASIVKKDDE